MDLRVAVNGFVPIYFWGIEPGKRLDLGTIAVRSGASLSGVVLDKLLEPLGNADLRLSPAGSAAPVPALTAQSTRSTPAGFFQFSGLNSGRYTLDVRGPR